MTDEPQIGVYAGRYLPAKGQPVALIATYGSEQAGDPPAERVVEYYAFFTGEDSTLLSERLRDYNHVEQIPQEVEAYFSADALLDRGARKAGLAINAYLDEEYNSKYGSKSVERRAVLHESSFAELVDLYLLGLQIPLQRIAEATGHEGLHKQLQLILEQTQQMEASPIEERT